MSPGRIDPTASRPTQPRPRSPPRRAPPRPDRPVVCPGFGFDRFRLFVLLPGHALHEKGLQRQKGDGPLVSSQEQRALLVPLMNRLSTADFVPLSVYIGFRLYVLLERRSGDLSSIDALGGAREACLLGEQFCWHPILPDPTSPPRRAPRHDPPVVCPGFGFDKWSDVQATCLRCFGGYEGGLSPRRTVLLAPSPARPRPVTLPCTTTRPARGMCGFWTRQIGV